MATACHTLRLILGDQLNRRHSWFDEKTEGVRYVLMEVLSETNYVRHHIQKATGFFLAMRAFAAELEAEGFAVRYLRLDDAENQQSISANLRWLSAETGAQRFEYQLPDEYRLDQELKVLADSLGIPCRAYDSEHFLSPRQGVADFFKGKKTYLLESFYRHIRKQYGIMMEDDGETPLSGRWNYDAENRKKLPRGQGVPPPLHFQHDASAIVAMLQAKGVETIGAIQPERFPWPVTRAECLALLRHFIQHQLPLFGTYQDAMAEGEYLLFHSKLSFAMNVKLLHPLEVVQACLAHWQQQQGQIGIAQIEGFVRQIVGWREYMRGVYWAKMPEYARLNYFGHQAKLPGWFWTGDTKMNCLKHAIGQSLEHAYAHHIQRLMVTGNFALLLGVHPDELDEWYLGIYMDAIEWVEITNTRGMSQFADGGIVGTKPYVSSANYIHKMSDYCANCHYQQQAKTGSRACPFNSLYWDFYDRHADKLANNPRIGMMYRLWEKMDSAQKAAILEQAARYKEGVEGL
jgi:deoxyribodipyrimidine photolyase-related protein